MLCCLVAVALRDRLAEVLEGDTLNNKFREQYLKERRLQRLKRKSNNRGDDADDNDGGEEAVPPTTIPILLTFDDTPEPANAKKFRLGQHSVFSQVCLFC